MNSTFSRSTVCALVLNALSVTPSVATLHQVSVANFAFTPADLSINQGDVVRWVWSNRSHTVTSGDPAGCTPDGLFSAPINMSNPTFEYTFDGAPGIIPYFCIPHCASMNMHGSITVLPDPTAAPEDPLPALRSGPSLGVNPNPFALRTVVSLELQQAERVSLVVYDASGRPVATLNDAALAPGTHEFSWDGRTQAGGSAPSGIYYARMRTADAGGTAILILVR